MSKKTIADYPLAETQPHIIIGPRGKALPEVTLEAVIKGEVEMQDLRITAEALRAQGEIAAAANRSTLAKNFNRAAELVNVPQDVIMATYELLRPGRAKSKEALIAAAKDLRTKYDANSIAEFIEEAAAVYEQRGLFTHRF
jgi:propanediol dehydratase small subunit